MGYSLVRFREPGRPQARAGLLVDGRIYCLSLAIADIIGDWERFGPQLEEMAARADGTGVAFEAAEILAPVEPRQVIQAGANYRKHVIDLVAAHRKPDDPRSEEQVRHDAAAMMDERASKGIPYFFLGLPTVISGPHDELVLPSYSKAHDWELELAAVIGKEAFRVTPEEALEHVFGYTMVNDITTRDLVFRKDMPEIGTDWFRAKNAPGFLPTGPMLLPARFFGDPQDAELTLKLNGQVMQKESTADMIFSVAQLVSHASQTAPLLPGDLVLTGSPAGNGAHWGRLLRDGDVMEATITGLGTQITRCRDEVRP
ncbi:fumarylacetoacetate hydrolase family protein [Arthrobacter sp. UC242_113]|uniref:fumarylacetoacetate hydrolase family protein n=1 Tax=Arthrobacter sp. UC242_113 TaxID=3374550 RepID=UPI0037584B11